MEKKQIIEAMHNRLHEIDPHAKAILFGSRARGTEHEGSDWGCIDSSRQTKSYASRLR